MDDILQLCEGNPGALNVMWHLIYNNMLNIHLFNIMKNNNITGSKIWEKYKECNQDICEYQKYLQSLISNNNT